MTNPAAGCSEWRWRSHWRQEHPAGWDGRHELTVCAYALNDGADVVLYCSCGRQARITSAPSWTACRVHDNGNAAIPLTALNEIAAAHRRGDGVTP